MRYKRTCIAICMECCAIQIGTPPWQTRAMRTIVDICLFYNSCYNHNRRAILRPLDHVPAFISLASAAPLVCSSSLNVTASVAGVT